MKLHQFLTEHRDELIEACVRDVKRDIPERRDDEANLTEHIREYIAEVTRVLRRAEGVSDGSTSSEVPAADVARACRRRGFRIEHLVPMYSAISVAVGEVGGRYNLDFAAAEYGVFNQSIDKHVADAIEGFAEEDYREHEAALGKRLGFLAHELGNSLQSASMAFNALEHGQVDIRGRAADVVRRNLGLMEHLINRTLVAARLSAGVKVGLNELPLAPLLREVESSAVLQRGIGLTVHADESLEVIADEHLLASAVSNLVQNAIKFSHDGASVVVRARGDGNAVVIEVEDECGGLPEGREDLFKPFVRASVGRHGVGLGLTIARDAMRALAGEVTVRDLPGKGCVFAARLPRAQQS